MPHHEIQVTVVVETSQPKADVIFEIEDALINAFFEVRIKAISSKEITAEEFASVPSE